LKFVAAWKQKWRGSPAPFPLTGFFSLEAMAEDQLGLLAGFSPCRSIGINLKLYPA
jgi:hypothetical protein